MQMLVPLSPVTPHLFQEPIGSGGPQGRHTKPEIITQLTDAPQTHSGSHFNGAPTRCRGTSHSNLDSVLTFDYYMKPEMRSRIYLVVSACKPPRKMSLNNNLRTDAKAAVYRGVYFHLSRPLRNVDATDSKSKPWRPLIPDACTGYQERRGRMKFPTISCLCPYPGHEVRQCWHNFTPA